MSNLEEPLPTEEPTIAVEEPTIAVEEPSVVVEEPSVVVEEPSVVVEEPSVVIPNEEILATFAALKSSQSMLIRRGALTTLSLKGITDPTEQEINQTICDLFNQYKNWDAVVDVDSSFYR
jgi:hypothetical protein